MFKYIIFRADEYQPGAGDRKLQHTQGLTNILAEYFDASDSPIPEPGYRPTDFVRVEAEQVPGKHGWSTHYKSGDWEVSRVEEYTPDLPMGTEFGMVVICYCKYSPVDAPLRPMPDRIVSLDSFGGNEDRYREYMESQKVKVTV